MILVKDLTDLDLSTDEGKMLMAAIAILTTIDENHLKESRFGTKSTPYGVIKELSHLSNKMYYEEEYKSYLKSEKRDEKIKNIMN